MTRNRKTRLIHLEVPHGDIEAVIAILRTHLGECGYDVARTFHTLELTKPRPPRLGCECEGEEITRP